VDAGTPCRDEASLFPQSRACPRESPHLNPPGTATINSSFLKLKAGYLFPEIARRLKAYTEENPDKAGRIIRCGTGDVTEPLPSAVRDAMHAAVDEQGVRAASKGYGPEQGYEFLRQAIVDNQFAGLGISADEVFFSDGSKCDTGNILDIFG
jgi:LL-diaminopimelate aminotransferase